VIHRILSVESGFWRKEFTRWWRTRAERRREGGRSWPGSCNETYQIGGTAEAGKRQERGRREAGERSDLVIATIRRARVVSL
jgi:hypothetical protein